MKRKNRKTVKLTTDMESERNGMGEVWRFSDDWPTSLLQALRLDHTLSQDKRSQTQGVPSKYNGPGGPRRLRDG